MFPFLARWHDSGRPASEFEADGIAAHQIAFGLKKPISDRYWRKLWKMVTDRDAGAGNWDRREIYLPRKQTARLTAAIVSEVPDENFCGLSAAVNGCADPLHPNLAEQETIERRVREAFDDLVACGRTRKAAMRQVCGFLATLPPYLTKTRHAIRLMVARWIKKPADSFGDGRRGNTGNHDDYELPVEDYELLVGKAAFHCERRVADAWRELWHTGQFTSATMQHFGKTTRASKSDVPDSVMRAVRPMVDILYRWRLGKKGYNSCRAIVNVSDVPIPPMLIVTGDDITLPVYYGVEIEPATATTPARDRMVRGQCLLFIDLGTMRILGWVLSPAPNYNALMILGELTRIFRAYSVPAGLATERGIWYSSALLKGRRQPAMSMTEREGRLEKMGIKFTHSISPQGKARMECVCGLIQNPLARQPGFCGRDERKDCPEDTRRLIDRVNRGQLRAREAGLHDLESFNKEFGKIVSEYNAEPQEGKVLKGLSPDAAFDRFVDPEYLPTKFTTELEHILKYHMEEARCTINGVRLPFGNGLRYKADALASRGWIGQPVKVWCDVLEWSEAGELAEVLVSDLEEKHFEKAYLETKPHPASWLLDPQCEDLGRARRENAGMESVAKALLKKLKPKFEVVPPKAELPVRRTIASADVHATGRAITEKSAKQPPGKRGGNVNRLYDILQQMDSDPD